MTTVVGRTVVGVADRLPGTRAAAVGEGTIRRSSPTSAWLPIVYGCDKTCTYCIVPFSRGPERSRPFDEIVAEARSLAAAGYREVTLLGQNVNSYGHDLPAEERFRHIATERWSGRRLDLHARPDLAELIRTIDGLRTSDGRPAIPRLRFVTSHPWDLSDRLVAALAECSSVCEHLHLPVQSGDDGVLHRMGRQYTIEHYRERLAAVRAAVPGDRHLHGRHRGVLRRDRGPVRGDAPGPPRRGLRPGVRGGLLGATGHAGRQPPGRRPSRREAAPPQHPARRPGGYRSRTEPGLARTDGRGPRRRDRPSAQPRPRGRPARETADASPAPDVERPGAVLSPAARARTSSSTWPGPATLLGSLVTVRVDHAGPYALRGALA